MKNDWPVKAQAIGGRQYKTNPSGEEFIDQNFDAYSVEYTFADGAKLITDGRCMANCENIYKSYALGTKGSAIVSKAGDCGAPSSTYKGLLPEKSKMTWESKSPDGQGNPYQNEWNDLIDAIRADKPYTELERGVYASLVSSLGRKAAHTGLELTLEDLLNCPDEYAPGVDKMTMDSPAPVQANAEGKYPIPQPGLIDDKEY
jgi:predicted dehydrogenase